MDPRVRPEGLKVMTDRIFKILKKETIYQDRFGSFIKAEIQRDLETGIYTYAIKLDVIAAIPHTQDGRTVIMKNYRYPGDEYFWELCLGTMDPDEEPEQTALRELWEETCIRTTTAVKVGEVVPVPGMSSRKIHVFAMPVDDATLDTAKCPEKMDEIVDLRFVTLDEIDSMIDRGEFRCGPSISALYLLHRHLARTRK
jgi:ADP-ribose pyrophosphatase